MIRILLFAILLTALALPAFAQTADPDKLNILSKQQEQAEKQAGALSEKQKEIQGEISGLQKDLIAASAQSRGYEKKANQARDKLSGLKAQERQLTSVLLSDRAALSDMLAALQRLERQPPPALLVHPQDAIDAARAANLLAYVSHDLQAKSDTLKKQISTLQDLRAKMDVRQQEISTSARAVDTQLKGIKTIISSKSKLNNQLDKDRKHQISRAKKLASEAQNLRDLISKFEQQAGDITPRIKPSPTNPEPRPHLKPQQGTVPPVYIPSGTGRFADARGHLPLPVFGKLSRSYGARLAGGGRAKGVSLRTAPLAQVVAPFTGRVEFSGEFNGDHVVILNVGNGYFIVLTGLGETFSAAGERVKAGEPLGLMPAKNRGKAVIFIEFRKNRTSINPKPWIGAALAKAKG